MAKTKDAFDPALADIASARRNCLMCDYAMVPPGVEADGEVPAFEEVYTRYEFHPLVSAVLWIVTLFERQERRSG